MNYKKFLKLFVLIGFIQTCVGNMDLYLPKNEVQRLFGVDNMQLYYIRDGVINQNAINFKPHMQPEQDTMVFVWKTTYPDVNVMYEVEQNVIKDSEKLQPANYSMANEMKRLIEQSTINIDKSGQVPHEEQKFHVMVPCTGARSGEVTVQVLLKLRLNIAVDPNAETEIKLQRLRICTEHESYRQDQNIHDNNSGKTTGQYFPKDDVVISTNSADGNNMQKPPYTSNKNTRIGSQSSGSFFISISVVTSVIVLALLIVFIVWRSRNGRKHQSPVLHRNGHGVMGMNAGTQQNQFLRPDMPNNAQVMVQGASWMQLTPIINDLGTDINEIRTKLSSIAVPRSSVAVKELLQEGTFARIYKGIMNNETPVLLKTVSNVASEEQVRLLLYESSLLRGLHHRNILQIKNVVIEAAEPPLIMFPYVKGGNLKRYLHDLKLTDPTTNSTFISEHQNKYEQASTQDLVEIGIQVACGMSYMIRRGLVHKDLATRNCVIDSELKVKITDNALSRDLFPDDYCCLGDNENRPVRWLALESLVHKVYSSSSDVWSFGVLLWELQSFASLPYEDIDDFEMAVYLTDGYRLSQPVNCPDHLYDIMAQCWHYSSDKRPKFNQILQMLTEFNAELGEYV